MTRSPQLDVTLYATTLPNPMASIFPRLFSVPIALFLTLSMADAAIVFKPGEKARYIAPGEEEINGNAEQLFHIAQDAEKRNNPRGAMKAYRTLVRKYPKDALAPGSAFRVAELLEQTGSFLPAAEAYRLIVEKYTTSPHFDEAIEGQFRIGEMFLNGKKSMKLLGISIGNSLDR